MPTAPCSEGPGRSRRARGCSRSPRTSAAAASAPPSAARARSSSTTRTCRSRAELPYEQSRALAEALAGLPDGATPRVRAPRARRPLLRGDRRRDRLDGRLGPDAALPRPPVAAGAARAADRRRPPARLPAAGAELARRTGRACGARDHDAASGGDARGGRAHDRRRQRRRPRPGRRRARSRPLGCSERTDPDRACRCPSGREAHRSDGQADRSSASRRPRRPGATSRTNCNFRPSRRPSRRRRCRRRRRQPRTRRPRRLPFPHAPRAWASSGWPKRRSSCRCRPSRCRRCRSRFPCLSPFPSPSRRCRRSWPTWSGPRPARRAPLGRAHRRRRFPCHLFRRCRRRRRSGRARAALASARTQKGRGTAGRNPFSPCTVLPC